MNLIDHVTMGASDLASGVEFVRSRLNVNIPVGGKHAEMGTHNCVMRTDPGQFLEMIAIDPDAPPTARPRWFGLDDQDVQRRILACPGPVGWVVRTRTLDTIATQTPLGAIKKMSRGTRSWRLTVPDTGVTAYSGLAPHFIEWDGEPHPSEAMVPSGISLDAIVLRHPDSQGLSEFLRANDTEHLAVVERSSDARIVFRFRAADGKPCEFS